MIQNGYTIKKTQRSNQVGKGTKIEDFEDDHSLNNNKSEVVYSCVSDFLLSNIFKDIININNSNFKCIFDTGANILLLNIRQLPHNLPILNDRNKLRIYSASNDTIDILSFVEKIPIRIKGIEYSLNAIISKKTTLCICGNKFFKK